MKPPLGLHALITDSSGTTTRWDPGDPKAQNRPLDLSFSTKRGEGFSGATCRLARRIDQDYPDLGLLDGVELVGEDGSTAFEGRLGAQPRSYDAGHSISLQLVSWMANARDRKFARVFVDRDLGRWYQMPLSRRAQIAGGQVVDADYSWTVEGGGLVFNGTDSKAISLNSTTEAWYGCPVGETVEHFSYIASEQNAANNASPTLFVTADQTTTTAESYTLTADGTLRGQTPTPTRRFLMLRALASAAHTPAAGTQFSRRYSAIAVYGNHGLTRRDISGSPSGLYASDVLTHLVNNYCPKLNPNGVQATTYPIPHLAFHDRTDPYDAFLEVNKYHLWELAVWENRTLHFYPSDLTDYDWEVRLSDPGVSVELQGDSTEDLANGIVVEFDNVTTGTRDTVTPDDDATLKDTSPENPANRHGYNKWTEITLSSPTTRDAALQLGRIALAEFNSPKAPGTIKVTGHIKDRAGNWQQGWKVRAGETVAITDHLNDRPRLIHETQWDNDSKTLTVAVEGPLRRLDAIQDRFATALRAANLV